MRDLGCSYKATRSLHTYVFLLMPDLYQVTVRQLNELFRGAYLEVMSRKLLEAVAIGGLVVRAQWSV